MDSSLEGPRRKLEWGRAHLATLRQTFGDWMDEWNKTWPYSPTGKPLKWEDELQTDEDGVEWWVSVWVEVPDLPPEWALLAGDAAHNLRSALDHLVCALGRKEQPDLDCDALEFPIRHKAPNEEWLRSRLGPTSDEDRDRIVGFLPHTCRDKARSDDLLALHLFDIHDKHRYLTPALSHMASPFVSVHLSRRFAGDPYGIVEAFDGPVRQGSPRSRIRADAFDKVRVQIAATYNPAFGEPPITLDEFDRIAMAVDEIISTFGGPVA